MTTLKKVTERLRRELSDRLSAADLRDEWPEIARRIAVCHANPCGKFDRTTCTDRGSACTRRRRWIERLVIGQCGEWDGESGECGVGLSSEL